MRKILKIIQFFLLIFFILIIISSISNHFINKENEDFIKKIESSANYDMKKILFPIISSNNFLITFGDNYLFNDTTYYDKNNKNNNLNFMSQNGGTFLQNFCGISNDKKIELLSKFSSNSIPTNSDFYYDIINFLKKHGLSIKKKEFSFLDRNWNPLYEFKLNGLIKEIVNLPKDKIYLLFLKGSSITCYDFNHTRSKFLFYRNIGVDAVNAISYYLTNNLNVLSKIQKKMIIDILKNEIFFKKSYTKDMFNIKDPDQKNFSDSYTENKIPSTKRFKESDFDKNPPKKPFKRFRSVSTEF